MGTGVASDTNQEAEIALLTTIAGSGGGNATAANQSLELAQLNAIPKVAAGFVLGSHVTTLIASTATQASANATAGKLGVTLCADDANTSVIYVGNEATMTATGGWFAILHAYDSPLLIPISDASKLYLYTTGSGQKFGWSVL